MNSYKTIQGSSTAEIEVKKSRFIGNVCHVDTEDEALEFLEKIRSENRMAKHNVYAYILRDEQSDVPRKRYSDDGEPQKTAGIPTLETLEHAELANVICVVTRYFGGVLLGTGGLVRAYTHATQAAIEKAQIVTVSRCVDIEITLPYSLYDSFVRLAKDCSAQILDTTYTDSVRVRLRMIDGTQDSLIKKATELLHGGKWIHVSGPKSAVFH